jgi:putative addiction module component (TIGR02574 family)
VEKDPVTSQTQAILDAALTLPEAERAELVDRLLETLPPEIEGFTDEEFHAELERRQAEFEKDPSVAVPWDKALLEE